MHESIICPDFWSLFQRLLIWIFLAEQNVFDPLGCFLGYLDLDHGEPLQETARTTAGQCRICQLEVELEKRLVGQVAERLWAQKRALELQDGTDPSVIGRVLALGRSRNPEIEISASRAASQAIQRTSKPSDQHTVVPAILWSQRQSLQARKVQVQHTRSRIEPRAVARPKFQQQLPAQVSLSLI